MSWTKNKFLVVWRQLNKYIRSIIESLWNVNGTENYDQDCVGVCTNCTQKSERNRCGPRGFFDTSHNVAVCPETL